MRLSNVIAIVLFTQVWPAYYIVMMIAGATISLGGLCVYGAIGQAAAGAQRGGRRRRQSP